MDLIIGGAYSGKLTCAVKRYGFRKSALIDLEKGLPEPQSAPVCLYHLEAYTRRCLEDGMNADEVVCALEPFICIPGAVIVSREIGCGIVPMDGFERAYRELHGQVLSRLSARAAHAFRVFVGIEEVLK